MHESYSPTEKIASVITYIPIILYLVIALILTILATYSVMSALHLTFDMVGLHEATVGSKEILIEVFHAITAIVLIETILVFFRTKHLAVQTLLVAGLTEMIRHILIFDVNSMEPMHIIALVGVIGVLIAGIVCTKDVYVEM